MNSSRTEGVKTDISTFLHSTPLIDIFELARRAGYGCAIYRLPRAANRHLILDRSGGSTISDVTIEEMGRGFIFHPYNPDNHDIKFLRADLHISEKNDEKDRWLAVEGTENSALEEIFNLSPLLHRDYQSSKHHDKITAGSEKEKQEFIMLVQRTINEIDDGRVQKVVVSRSKTFTLTENFDVAEFFDTLCNRYPNAFVYLTCIPGINMWIGATPEVLIEIDHDKHFKTTALAATQPYDKEVSPEDASWSTKDIEEQALVSRYIINCFKKIRLREFEELGPRTYVSGNLIHLKTDFSVDMEQVAFPQLGSVMLDLLHPTSAVCGMPKEPAQEFIQKHEKFDREYYSGFLGPVNIQDETHLFVNLRCMKVLGGKAQLFAGAGIIASSSPEKEWTETEIKMDILLKVYNELY